jgi:DNA adenine methylase
MSAIQGVPQPFPYQGSKKRLASYILSCIPDQIATFYEPFAGSAAISLAVAYKKRARNYCLNDVNEALISLWDAILNHPESLANQYAKLWQEQTNREKDYYNKIRTIFNQEHKPQHFLYLLARCVKAAIRYNSQGEFNNSPDNRRRGMNPAAMRHNIMATAELLGGKTELTSTDYTQTLKYATPYDFVYMDPPYQGVCGKRNSRYSQGVHYEHFVEALTSLNKKHVPFVVSYDGRTGNKVHGRLLPDFLGLQHFELLAGKSTQATLLGHNHNTYESLYVSKAALDKIGHINFDIHKHTSQLEFSLTA